MRDSKPVNLTAKCLCQKWAKNLTIYSITHLIFTLSITPKNLCKVFKQREIQHLRNIDVEVSNEQQEPNSNSQIQILRRIDVANEADDNPGFEAKRSFKALTLFMWFLHHN